MATVKLTNVKKVYQGGVVAVNHFNLDIADQEFVVFVGPSGCGKSTTMRMVAGLEDITEGTVEIDGIVVNDLQPKDRHVSMVFQNYALYPHLSVYENMAFPLRISKQEFSVFVLRNLIADPKKKLDEIHSVRNELVSSRKEAEKAKQEATLAFSYESKVEKAIKDSQAELERKIQPFLAFVKRRPEENEAKIAKIRAKSEGRLQAKLAKLEASKEAIDAKLQSKIEQIEGKQIQLETKLNVKLAYLTDPAHVSEYIAAFKTAVRDDANKRLQSLQNKIGKLTPIIEKQNADVEACRAEADACNQTLLAIEEGAKQAKAQEAAEAAAESGVAADEVVVDETYDSKTARAIDHANAALQKASNALINKRNALVRSQKDLSKAQLDYEKFSSWSGDLDKPLAELDGIDSVEELLKKEIAILENFGKEIIYAKMDNDEIYARVVSAARTLGITPYLTRKPKALSGGQRQRVAIGRAMVRDMKVFLMDEPLSNLDAKLRNQMRAELILLRQKIKSTFIYVTHDQTEAMTLGDRIVVMRDGEIMQVGTPMEVFEKPENLFVAGFIGSPAMNTMKCDLLLENGKYFVNPFGTKLPVDGAKGEELKKAGVKAQPIVLGVRPEHMTICKPGEKGIPATLIVNEMMGNEYHLHVETDDGTDMIVRVVTVDLSAEERGNLIVGAKLQLRFPGKVMHFFNPETEENLLYGKKNEPEAAE